ncbi:hypothetical protein N0V93_004587 [Gnomoniopsis smithogilvyi]|uniref:Uncharacterized protein n=1 Tax=Gnomoniopsis smithogilvyi TaxID=1191159 RepID=A0A9W8YSP3_9PEZI|nr:hypothetical protein N0V93_004587 [Gnomoniopsis smithogilvyi]
MSSVQRSLQAARSVGEAYEASPAKRPGSWWARLWHSRYKETGMESLRWNCCRKTVPNNLWNGAWNVDFM